MLRPAFVLIFLVSALTLPSTASAKPKGIWGPVDVNGVSQFPIYKELGVTFWQSALDWSTIAATKPSHPTDPNDPAYKWPSNVDDGVAEAAKYGMSVALMGIRTPRWANGGKSFQTPPTSAKSYADFMTAASRRYPRVRIWMVWGEPNRSSNFAVPSNGPGVNLLSPKKEELPTFSAGQRRADRRYAELVDAAYGALKKRNPLNKIVGGMTATVGAADPVNWVKYMKLANGKPPRMDMYGHNPYGLRRPDLDKPQVKPGAIDFSDLDTLTGLLDRYLARDGRNRKLPIFVSEYTVPSDYSGFEFNFYVDRTVGASWLRSAFKIVRRDKRIYNMAWFSLYDSPPPSPGEKGSPTGLIDPSGTRKPVFAAFAAG